MAYVAQRDFKWEIEGKEVEFKQGQEVKVPTSFILTFMCHGYIYNDGNQDCRKNFSGTLENKMVGATPENKTAKRQYRKRQNYTR